MSGPRRLIIEPTSRCNLRCSMCLREVLQEPSGDMALEVYGCLLPLFPPLEALDFTGYGEPLLHPHLLDMVALARQHLPATARLSFITNGSLLTPGLARELVASGLDELGISLEGARPPTHEELRRGGDLQKTLEGLSLIAEARRRLGRARPRLVVHMVALRRNLLELPELVRLIRQRGAEGLVVSHLLPHTQDMIGEAVYSHHSAEALAYFQQAQGEAKARKLDLRIALDYVPYIYTLAGLPPLRNILPPDPAWLGYLPPAHRPALELVARVLRQAAEDKVALSFAKLVRGEGMGWEENEAVFARVQQEAEAWGLALTLPPLHPKAHRECGFIMNRVAFISWDGQAHPCQNLSHAYTCYLNSRQKHITPVTFGHIQERGFPVIWDSPDYQSFRALTERFDFSPCGDCGFAEGCSLVQVPHFEKDCYFQPQPCGDCPWSRGLLQC